VRIFQVDAFTQNRFTGNPASVVLDADGADEALMQSLAREYPHAETAFVLAPQAADHDLRLRFFNARKEAAFVGHATIAAHAVLLALGRRESGVSRQHSGTGVIEVTARSVADAEPRWLIEFRQSAPELDVALPLKSTLRVAEALQLPVQHLHDLMPARIARKGSTRLLVPVLDAAHLDSLAPRFETLISLGKELGADGFFVFALRRNGEAYTTEARMFCPALGIAEDPVSGNAHAMLAAYLHEAGKLGTSQEFIGLQGRHVDRPGEVRVRLELDQGRLVAAHIGGTATIVSAGTLNL
jgi:PhzF family phenazine biosynthesis protein